MSSLLFFSVYRDIFCVIVISHRIVAEINDCDDRYFAKHVITNFDNKKYIITRRNRVDLL